LSSVVTVLVLVILRALGGEEVATKLTKVNLGWVDASKWGKHNGEKLLILTPLKDAAPYLDEYFENLQRLNYPKNLISLGFLISDTNDATVTKLHLFHDRLLANPNPYERYSSISILTFDSHFSLSSRNRHSYELQPVRRTFLARARNYLLTGTLREDHAWVLWLDTDVIKYDPNILEDLMGLNKDVVVPNCLWDMGNWDFWAFDRNSWAETEESLKLLSTLDPDYILVEGYHEFPTHRLHLADMPTHLGKAYVPLDGVGATFLLVKAGVHREGAVFPTFPVENAIETEGFAKMAKKMGFEVVGVPGMVVFHARND